VLEEQWTRFETALSSVIPSQRLGAKPSDATPELDALNGN
jgi:hypothetical protein